MMTSRLTHSSRRAVVILLAAVILVGVVLFASGVTPWVAPAAVTFCLTLALGQWLTWPGAFAAAVVLQFAAACTVIRFSIWLPGGLALVAALLLLVIGVAAVIVVARIPDLRLPRWRQIVGSMAVTVGMAAFVTFVVARASADADFEWAMRNDAVWNLATTRFMIVDGGIENSQHPNSSPLTAALMAAVAAVGRAGLPATEMLRHDVTRVVEFWLLAGLGSAFLAGLLGFAVTAGSRPWRRWIAAIVAGVLPVTWFVFGFAADYGFYNATIVVVLLIASWLLWLEASKRPVIASGFLGLAAVGMLATWAPLALVSLGLSVAALLPRVRRLVISTGAPRWKQLGLVLVPLIPVPIYAVAVTLPDLRRDGAALAVEGAFMPFTPLHILTIAVVAFAVVLLASTLFQDNHLLLGFSTVIIAGAVALGYLVYQRRATASLWGYYPAKFAWFLAILLLVILCAVLLRVGTSAQASKIGALLLVVVSGAMPFTLMSHLPPPGGWRTAITPISIALQNGGAVPNTSAKALFDVVEDGTPSIALSYGSESLDRFLNSWLLQLESPNSEDPIRLYSYILNPTDDVQACEALRAWDRPVRVVTSDDDLESRLRASCSGADFDVDVLPAPIE